MKLLFILLGAVITSVAINWLVLPRYVSAQERTLTMFGSVKGKSVPDGYAELAFNFFDKDTEVLAYRSVSTADVKDGIYTASLYAGELIEGKEYYVLVTLPSAIPGSLQKENRDATGVVLLQSETPGIQQTGHVNISGTLIAGAIKTNAFQMSIDAAAGRVLTSDASGNGTWQSLPPPSGTAGGDLFGTYPNPLVDGLQGYAVASTAPAIGQVLKWSGSAWSPDADLRDAFWQASGSDIFYNAGNVGVGTSSPVYSLHVVTSSGGRAIYGIHTAASGVTYGGRFESDSTSGRGVYGYASSSSGTTYGVFGQSYSTSGWGVFGYASATSGTTYGGRFESASTSGKGVFGYATANSGPTYGMYGQSASTSGTGVYGVHQATTGTAPGMYGITNSTENYAVGVLGEVSSTTPGSYSAAVRGLNQGIGGSGIGVWGSQDGSGWGVYGTSVSGRGVYGWAYATSGTNYGVYGQSASTEGRGIFGWATASSGTTYGGRFQSDSTSGIAVNGWATAGSGATYGVWGQSASTSGRGVYGYVTATSGSTNGVYGRSESTNGLGVVGYAPANNGINYGVYAQSDSTNGRGVLGWATAISGTTYGVVGRSDSTSGYGVYSSGNFAATGTKSFQIDHPLMPETHYLNHFCTEGPEPYNVYSGNVVTDAQGYANVQLPDYFESINRDFRYQITVIDGAGEEFVQARVVRKIQNNHFVIRTSMPHVEVSWRVEAVRNDLWVQKYGFVTEQEKPEEYKGKYLRPDLYGMPKEYGIFYRPDIPDIKIGEQKAQKGQVHRVLEHPRPTTSNPRRMASQKTR
ncbi:MAG TPA: hypothetical protein VNK96_00515 [Fimbriimonadales bacterium]|nr:hypothetical protein [Fimbriimonadales bacterium]